MVQMLSSSQERSASSADYLAENMAKAPVLMIPCIEGRVDNADGANASAQAGTMGSITPAAWSFMPQLGRVQEQHGPPCTWRMKKQSELLGIPRILHANRLIPIAYTKGTDFRRLPPSGRDRYAPQRGNSAARY